jgi:hypothetical protein
MMVFYVLMIITGLLVPLAAFFLIATTTGIGSALLIAGGVLVVVNILSAIGRGPRG